MNTEAGFMIPPILRQETKEGEESHLSGRLDMEEVIIIIASGHSGLFATGKPGAS